MGQSIEGDNVRKAINMFFEAMDRQDMELLEDALGQDEQVVHIGTDAGERWNGWKELKEDTYRQFEDMTSFKVEVRNQRIQLGPNCKVAWFAQEQDMRIGKPNGDIIRLDDARFTGVLEKRDGRWKMVQSHLSVPDS